MDFDDVLSQRLLCNEQFAALRARHVADVAVHLDMVIVATALVCHEAAAVAFQHRHLAVHQHLVTTEQVRYNIHTQHLVMTYIHTFITYTVIKPNARI